MKLIQQLSRGAAALATVMCLAGPGFAAFGAPENAYAAPMPAPTVKVQPKPAPTSFYSGRWYEIARTPNSMQANCQASTFDFAGWVSGAFKAVQTCHQGAPTGPTKVMKLDGKVLPASQNAKIQLGMLGGLISQEYWVLDHADNNDWLIMSTANEHYVWLLSRVPVLSADEKAQAMARLQQLGFSLAHMAFPQQMASR